MKQSNPLVPFGARGFFALWVSKWVFGKKKKPKTLEFIGLFMVGMEGLEPTSFIYLCF